MNFDSTNKDVARRLIDFLSGVAYAGEGKIKKVAANTYIITPYHVDIEGDLIDELENNGLYFCRRMEDSCSYTRTIKTRKCAPRFRPCRISSPFSMKESAGAR